MLYSHSRLETFENCPLKFKYQYVEKVDVPRRDSIEAFLGSRVHETLEALYKNKMMEKVWSRDEYHQHYRDGWLKQRSDKLYIVNKQYSEDDYFRQGQEALTRYWERYYPFDQEKTIALEKRFYMTLDDGGHYKFQGFIDRISKTADGVWQIRDYKTRRSLPTQQEAEFDRQLALYQIGLQQMWNDTDRVELIWHYLIHDEEIKVVKERSEIERTRIDTIHLIQKVEKAIENDDFPYKESALCEWCDYFDICPAKKHLAKIRTLPPREFKEDDGVKLVDRFAALKEEQKRIGLELDAVQEEICQYAEEFLVDKLYGSSNYVRVGTEDSYRLPSKTVKLERELREELEEFLKRARVWEEVSQLNSQRLIKLYKTGELAAQIRAEVERFLTPEIRRRITIGRRRDVEEGEEQ